MTEIEIPVSRIAWSELPISVRGEIESRLGAGVRSGSTQPGGFSRGMASRLAMVDGRTVFAKAIPIRDRFAHRYRIEGDTATQLPAEIPAPAVRFMLEIDGWRVLVFDDVTGRHPRFDQPTELAAVLAVVEDMARMLTPNPLPDVPTLADDLGSDLSGWRKLAGGELAGNLDEWSARNVDRLAVLESGWERATVGQTLLHTDLRADNMLVRPDGTVMIVDWSWPSVGAAWVDLVFLATAFALHGVDPEPILGSHALTRGVDPDAISALVCALAGYWIRESRRPGGSQSVALRRHRAESGRATVAWLQRRVGWK
ncbi:MULTISPECIES: phosphotransferase [Nocardia]|uniref:Phosphotransferase family enzyme n=3 Tax=Nocardia TaxID=1817 RepID=A0A366D3H1_9NOCA|nr:MULTISPECIES: phosphotransferase [Nocardia]MCP2287145.1 Phosphotransferase enzyme family protein [Nocardia amikacinitolerans]MBF6216243.1 phosphotransferase [Nocardia puris]MBF6260137.1 phosphotransferase [Nocardia farcinica]MBF6362333.1 phosphotransferase [Nocardia farcinica]MBF6376719.1 phosphotransferase [Nocardia farcinica]